MRIRLLESHWSVRKSVTRLPFRYGSACLTWCPQAVVCIEAEVEHDGRSRVVRGYSGDCLPPSWFDKRPGRSYEQQIADMRESYDVAAAKFADRFRTPTIFFDGWLDAQPEAVARSREQGWPDLLGGFGVSLVERAVIDAAAQSQQLSFHQLIVANHLQLDVQRVDVELPRIAPADFLPNQPAQSIHVRHTVGLIDPLTDVDVPEAERLNDGEPQTLEDYIRDSGIRYFKIKVANRADEDLERLEKIAQLVEAYRGHDYRVTLDGNEQYSVAEEFDRLIEQIKSRPQLETFWRNTLLIEQPLSRDIALQPTQTEGIRQLANEKPVIIDESDQSLESYAEALRLGYRGVSSKNCKGPIRSLVHAATNWEHNRNQRQPSLVMTGEDLCCVGVIPVQSDLCLVATLGLKHVERNGHHYHNGLSYLPHHEQQAALAAHPDLYVERNGAVRLNIQNGQLQIGTLVSPKG